jgi:hypothetical protein
MNISLRAVLKTFWLLAALAFGGLTLHAQGLFTRYTIIENTTFQYELPPSFDPYITQQPQNGTASITSSNGTDYLEYTPDVGYRGLDSIQVYLFIPPFDEMVLGFELNVVPSVVIAQNDYEMELSPVSITEIPVLENDSTSTGNLYLKNISVVNNGLAQISTDSLTINFTPDLDYVGITYLLYTACDENDVCDQGMLTIRMTDYTPPDTDSTFLTTNMNAPIPVVLPFNGFTPATPPAAGGELEQVNSFVYIYHPDDQFVGLDSFDFELVDGNNVSTASVWVNVLNTPAPNEFAIQDFAYLIVDQDSVIIDVLTNDVNNQSLSSNTLDIDESPDHGTAFVLDGKIIYTPNPGFEGVDYFTYEISNLFGQTEYAPVYAIVSNHYPVFYTFELTTPVNTPMVINYQVPISGFDFMIENEPEFGTLTYYPGDTTLDILGQEISGYNLLIYEPDPDFYSEDEEDIDEFEVKYCVNGNCPTVKIDVFVQDLNVVDTFCVGDKCVWSGDTDNNGIVNIQDVLPIGLGMGEAGVSRQNPSTSWYGQHSDAWNGSLGALKPKYCDTDGNGIITHEDTSAISQHYLKTHNLVPEETPVSKPVLFFDIVSQLPADSGDLVVLEISLGQESNPLLDMYGLSFIFNYNNDLVDPSTINFQAYENSWLSFYSPMLSMTQKPSNSRMDIALTRTNGITASGYGAIGQIAFIITEDLAGIRFGKELMLQLELTSAHAMDGYGQFARLNDVSVEVPVKIGGEKEKEFSADQIITYPNPTTDYLFLHLNGSDNLMEELAIFSVDGKEVLRLNNINQRQLQLDVSRFDSGIYFLQIQTEQGPAVKKVQIYRY